MLQAQPQFHRPLSFRPTTTKVVVPSVISEADYWEYYYEDPDHHYEWNHGYVEEKGVSDQFTTFHYEWFFELLRNYLRVTEIGKLMALETGFRLVLPNKTTIRKPDLAVILNSNPVPWRGLDRSYRGICDLCVEALSDSDTEEVERDTVTKFTEYAQAGVKEYYILYAHGEPQEFYRLTPAGVYAPIPRRPPDLICSNVLPGFQFRVSDLERQPSPEKMSEDGVYQSFMLPAFQAERHARRLEQEARLLAEAQMQQERDARLREQEARLLAEAQAQQERDARLLAEAQVQQEREARQRLEAELREWKAQWAKFRQPPE
jgi:Uma2 family endonuclease